MGAGATVARALINCSIAKTRVRKIGEITLPSLSLPRFPQSLSPMDKRRECRLEKGEEKGGIRERMESRGKSVLLLPRLAR